MKKVLFVASVIGHIKAFHLPYLEMFKEQDFETHVAANGDMELPFVDVLHNIPFARSPLNKNNISAYKQLKRLINENEYNIVHCHTPVAAMLTRLAARKARKKGTKVIYTAHGFHFFKGAPKKNWMIFYPIEKLCARWTDVLITINEEDFALAKKKIRAKRVEYVPGVGVDLSKFKPDLFDLVTRVEKRKALGLCEQDIMLLSVGELNNNKNHATVLNALSDMPENVHYFVAGSGINAKSLAGLAKSKQLDKRFHLLGLRSDIVELLNCADIFCFPSKREGLPVSVIEAMACGLPCVVSTARGNTDLINDGDGGYLCSPTDSAAFVVALNELISSPELREKIGKNNKKNSAKYSKSDIVQFVGEIYLEEINGQD